MKNLMSTIIHLRIDSITKVTPYSPGRPFVVKLGTTAGVQVNSKSGDSGPVVRSLTLPKEVSKNLFKGYGQRLVIICDRNAPCVIGSQERAVTHGFA